MPDDAPPATQVLVIDDDPRQIELIADLLETYAYVVLTARSGESGLDRARYARPDLILLDIGLQGIDGFETCRRLKAHPATAAIPVIYTTGRTGTADTQRAFDLGAVDYVIKPVNGAELLARVGTHIELARHRIDSQARADLLAAQVREATTQLRAELQRHQAEIRDRDRLLALMQIQGEQLEAATRRWVEPDQRDGRPRTLVELDAERAGLVQGWLTRARHLSARDDVIRCLDQAAELLAPLRDGVEPAAPIEATQSPLDRLSDQERVVFRHLVSGQSNKEIASALDLASTTVSTYRVRILRKLEVSDVPALVRLSLLFDPGAPE